jgi:hypothetical protein
MHEDPQISRFQKRPQSAWISLKLSLNQKLLIWLGFISVLPVRLMASFLKSVCSRKRICLYKIRRNISAGQVFQVVPDIKVLAGLAGVTLAARLGAGAPASGLGYELDVIAAVVVGGTSLSGGRGSVIGTMAGTVFIGVLNNGLNLANVDPYTQKVALGVVILAAVWFDQIQKRRK